uniref:Uncharacterized protein n=1 Tax=viral metagenome TaxID=1070528 RepID=A0A6M3J5E6_9ZZZZ
MIPEAALEIIMNDLDMETVARLAGLNLDPPKRYYRCDNCTHRFRSSAKPEDILDTACQYCEGGSIILDKKEGV